MGVVIHVDFGTRRQGKVGTAEQYLQICQANLDEDDYLDLLDAIRDPAYYYGCDEVIQDLVDGYYAQQRYSK